MRLTQEIEDLLITEITERPERALVLPDWCYRAGKDAVVIYRDGLPWPLHRWLYTKVVGELEHSTLLIQRDDVHPRNVNPLLFLAEPGRHRGTACPNGHAYAGNEMPDNAMGFRCVTCYRAWLERHSGGGQNAGQRNAAKTHCPQGHAYDEQNTMHLRDGRRRCVRCNREQSQIYRERLRAA